MANNKKQTYAEFMKEKYGATNDYYDNLQKRLKEKAEREKAEKEAEEKRKKEENARRLRELFDRDEDIAPVAPASDSEKAAMAQSLHNSFTASKGPLFSFNEDIAPVLHKVNSSKKTEKEDTWFDSGAFDDGYQRWDVTKTILGTVGDIGENLIKGIGEMPEKLLDAGMTLGTKMNQSSMQQAAENEIVFNALLGNKEKVDDTLKRYATYQKDVEKETAEFVAKDIIKTDKINFGVDELSVLGEKSDALVQSAGQLGATAALQAVGVPWWLTTGATSFGAEAENAFNQGATFDEAILSSAISAGAEVLTEKLSGGIKFGGKTLDEGLTKALASRISNKFARTALKLGLDATGEGAEEWITEDIGRFGQWLTYQDEKALKEMLYSEEAMDEKIQAFIGGAALGGVISTGNAIKSASKGVDYVTGLTKNEQTVVDKEVVKRIAEQETDGKKLTNKEKGKIRGEVMSDLDKGYISTDIIEETLGGDTYKSYKDTTESEDALKKELDELRQMKSGEMNDIQRDRLAELKAMNLDDTTKRDELKKQLGDEVFGLVKDSRLVESYNERGRRSQAYQADTSKYDEKQRKVIQAAIDSGILNNTNRTHEFVDWIAKVSADKGVPFDFLNNEKLKESGFAIDGKFVNGYYDKKSGKIGINVNSAKALNTVVGHEITHVCEGTDFYKPLHDTVIELAKIKGDYQARVDALSKLYDPEDVDSELVADLVGDYLFTDSDFINNLSTKHRNVFQKIYDEIKYLCKVATAGSKEARELERVKKLFADAYRQSGKAEGDTKYSLSDNDGKKLSKEQQDFFKDSKVRDENGNLKVMYHGSPETFTVFDKSKAKASGYYGKGFYFTDSDSHAKQYGNTYDVYLNITNPIQDGTNNITKEQLRKFVEAVSENEDYGIDNYGYGATVDSVTDSVYGKSDFAMLMDVNASCVGDMVAAIELFNEVNGTDYNGIITPTETVAFYPEQIKRTDNKKPTGDPDIRFSLSEDIDTFDNSLYNEIELSAVERDRVQSEALTWHVANKGQPFSMPLSNGFTYLCSLDNDGIVHIYGKEESVNIHEFGGNYDNRNTERPDRYVEKFGNQQGIDTGDNVLVENGRDQIAPFAGNVATIQGKGRSHRAGYSKNDTYAHRNPKGWHFNDDGSVEVTYSDGTKETENAAPIKKTSSNDDVFFDASHDAKSSLSAKRETPKRYGNYNVYGKDVMLEQDIAPIGASVSNIEQEERGVSSATTDKEYVGMDDFLNRDSSVWKNVDYNDDATKASIMKNTHEDMVKDGAIVVVADDVINSVKQSYPDLRGVKKNERTLRLREAMKTLKSNIRQFLSGLKDQSFDFEVNGKVLEARLYNTGINEVLEKVTQEKANMLYTSEEIFKNARYLYSTPDYGGDPNVYRWNYFYTPVQIGQETVGVRIAVRDLALQGESQIYNWGIKKDASLGGEGGDSVNRRSHGASSDASNNSIADFAPFVKPDEDTVSDNFAPTAEDMADFFPSEPTVADLKREAQGLIDEAMKTPDDAEKVNRLYAQYTELQEKIKQAEAEEAAWNKEQLASLDDADAPPEVEAPYYSLGEDVKPDNPFENRDIKAVGNRKVKAYMYENPEVKPYFQEAANVLLGELNRTQRGERLYTPVPGGVPGQYGSDSYGVWTGVPRQTSPDIAYLLDELHYTYDEIEKGIKAIIEDNGKENNACSKRIEFLLNDRLLKGYPDMDYPDNEDMYTPPNQEYINLLNEKQITEYNEESFKRFIESAEEYAPMAETPAPVTENADVAPVKQAEETKTVKQTEENPRKTAEILFEETEGRKKRGIWSLVKEYVLDNGMVFEDISKKHNRRELEARWNSIRNSEKAAQRFIKDGKNGVRSIETLKDEIEQSGLIEDFNYYMYHKHNVDRMSLESRVAPKIAELKEQLGELDDAQIAELAEEKIRRGASAEDANRIRNAKVYTRLTNFKNKAVFGESETAEVSQAKVDAWEKKHPEFKEWAEEVYANNKLLRQFMVDNGILSEETAELWDSLYPHYVPIRRKNQDGAAINVPLDTNKTGVNAPIKRATGGDSDFYDLFSTMSQRAIQTYKAVAKNRFGTELLDVLGTTVSQSEAGLNDAMDSVEDNDGLLKAGKHGANPTFTIFEDGKRVEFEISEEMYDAMRPAGDLLSYTNEVANKISNFRRATLTEYSALFLAKNAVKDMQDVFLNSQHAVRTYGAIPEAIKEMATGKGYIQEYLDNGGEANTYFDSETNSFTKENKAWEAIKTVTGLNAVQKANNVVEMLPRLAEYIASRKMGRSIDVSMLDAARVTTNFAAGGKLTKFANRNGATFLNASVQGAIQQVRNVREAKMNGLKGVLGLAAKVVLVGGTALLLNNLMWDDDEEYEELSDYVKQNYYIVGKFGDGKFVRIPKGRATAVIQNAFEQMQNLVTGNDEVDLKAFLDLAVSNLAPNDPIDNNVLSPIMQVKNNETWYGEDLVPSRLQKLPDAEQYDETTDSLSKWLGEKLDFSPYKINYLLDQYSGFVGDAALPMLTPEAESGDMPIVGDIEQPWLKEAAKLFVAPAYDAFTTDSTMKNQDVSDFYEMMDELTVGANASGATDEDILKSKYMNSINSELGELYAKKREIQNSNLSDAEKYEAVREVQKQITELAENSLNAYDNISIEEYSTHGVSIGEYANVGDRYFKRNKDGEWEKLDDKELSKFLATKDAGDSYYATDGENHYKWYEPSEDSDEKPSWKKISDDELERQEEVTSGLGISASDYWGNKDEYTYAYKYPGKYAISKAVGGYDTYTSYTSEIKDIEANNDSSSGVKDKDLVKDYIFNLDIDYGEKAILYRSMYDSKADKMEYNAVILNYLNSRDDISYEDMVTILEELDMTIGSDGYVYWD